MNCFSVESTRWDDLVAVSLVFLHGIGQATERTCWRRGLDERLAAEAHPLLPEGGESNVRVIAPSYTKPPTPAKRSTKSKDTMVTVGAPGGWAQGTHRRQLGTSQHAPAYTPPPTRSDFASGRKATGVGDGLLIRVMS